MKQDIPVDADQLREAVKDKYREVAIEPHGDYHFHTGRPLARRLGYDDDVVDALPDDMDTQAVTVFHGRVPESLPPGPTLVIEPDASCDLWQLDDGAGVAHRVS